LFLFGSAGSNYGKSPVASIFDGVSAFPVVYFGVPLAFPLSVDFPTAWALAYNASLFADSFEAIAF
jgi:hypothetical protein